MIMVEGKMCKTIFVLVSIKFIMTGSCLGATLLVPEDYTMIQDALDVAVSGDIISVGPGTYNESISVKTHDVTLLSRTPHGATIDGGGSGHVVTFNPYRGTIEDFVISGSGTGIAAGIFTSQASQVIRNNIITGNNHGIVASSWSDVIIENNIIIDNGSWGAGIRMMTDASGTIVNNYIARNRYGIYSVTTAEVVIANNTIVDNDAWNMYLTETMATISNNIVANAEYGILFGGGYDPDITGYVSLFLTISYNDFWNHSSEDYFAELGGIPSFISGPFDPQPGTGEIHADPHLSSAIEYQLSAGSPCIDAGDNNGVPTFVSTDLDSNSRFYDDPATADTGAGAPPIVDMGVHEFGSQPPAIPVLTLWGIVFLIFCPWHAGMSKKIP